MVNSYNGMLHDQKCIVLEYAINQESIHTILSVRLSIKPGDEKEYIYKVIPFCKKNKNKKERCV